MSGTGSDIPYTVSSIPDGPWLIFAPHPDDETFGMGGTILLALEQGIEVHVIIVTDGALGGSIDRERLVSVRKEEARKTCSFLGIQSLEFWDCPDGNLQFSNSVLVRVVNAIESMHPATVFFPSLKEPNRDHVVCGKLVWYALKNVIGFQGNAIAYEISVQLDANLLIDITSVSEEKDKAMGLYESQLSENNYIEVVNAINCSRTYTLPPEVKSAEGFQVFDASVESFYPTETAPSQFSEDCGSDSSSLCEKMPLVSVIIRTMNRPDELKEAIHSVSVQTYPEIELVVVNDGGVSVKEVIEACEHHFSKVKYVELDENMGRPGASAEGLQNTSGTYILFLDDDDLIDEDHIEYLVEAVMHSKECRVAYCGVRVQEEGKNYEVNHPFDPALLKFGNFIPIHSYIFHRSLLDEGAHIDRTMIVYDDWDFLLQLSTLTPFLHLNRVSATYRANGASGFGIVPDRNVVLQGLDLIWTKWSPHWSTRELVDMLLTIYSEKLEVDLQLSKTQDDNSQLIERVAQLEATVNALAQEMASQNEVNIHLNESLKASNEHVKNIVDSTMWRALAPLRSLVAYCRKTFRG